MINNQFHVTGVYYAVEVLAINANNITYIWQGPNYASEALSSKILQCLDG